MNGVRYHLDLSETIDLAVLLGQYEPHTAAAFRRHARAGWTVLDIGANIGVHALALAKLVGPSGRVFAFEPTQYAYRKLIRNRSLNAVENVYTVKIALSNRNLYGQEVKLRATWPTSGKPVVQAEHVDFRRLDDWCEENAVDRVDLIKLDVDGQEYAVLDGARALLIRSRSLIVMETGQYHFSDSSQNPLALLRSIGYRFFDEKTSVEFMTLAEIERRLTPSRSDEALTINVIAMPPGAPE